MESGADSSCWKRKMLEIASAVGSTALAKALLEAGVDFSSADDVERTPVYTASRNGNLEVLKLLVAAGADITIPDDEGQTPVYVTAFDGHVKEARLLLDHGADLSIANKYGMTPLNLAADGGLFELAELFLENGANIEDRDRDGWTPLASATYAGHVRVAKLLIDHGANISPLSNYGWTPLRSACADGRTDVVKLLVSNGADVTVPEAEELTPLHSASYNGHADIVRILLDHGSSFSARAEHVCTPLHAASESGHLEVARELLERGADTSIPGFHRRTPLSTAAFEGHVEVAKLLIGYGGDTAHRDDEGWSLVNLASSRGHVDMVNVLIANGTDLEIPNDLGAAPLYNASGNGYVATVRTLLEGGAYIESANFDGATPLLFASSQGHVELITALLEKGANVHCEDKDGGTPLLLASLEGYVDTVAALLRNGASVSTANTNGLTPLQAACSHGHVETTKLLLANGADARAADAYGETSLSVAARGGHDQVCRLLLDKGADCMTRNKGGWSPLHNACSCGQDAVQVVRTLLSKGAAIDETTNEELWTPLSLASRSGSVDVVTLLLDNGADSAIANEDGWSPLHTASVHGHVAVVNVLLERGVPVLDEDGRPILHSASFYGHIRVVKALFEHNPDVPPVHHNGTTPVMLATCGGHSEVLQFLLSKGFTSNAADGNGTTALHCAVELGHAEMARTLLESGAAMTPNQNGYEPIHIAAAFGKTDVVKILIDNGADISVRGRLELTALHLASEAGHVEVAEMLLRHGADFDVANMDGTTPLHLASAGAHLDAVRLLLGSGAGTGPIHESGATPLHVAAGFGHVEVLEELLESGADLTATTKNAQTALFLASEFGRTECARNLLEHGAEVSAADFEGRIPMHWASDGGHVELVKLLLEHGSNLSVGDNFGLTPLMLASSSGHVELTKLLIEKQTDPEVARNDGRWPVDPSLFTPYISMAGQQQRIRALYNDGSSAPIMDQADDWIRIQTRLMEKEFPPRPANAMGQTLSIVPTPQQDTSKDTESPPRAYRPAVSSESRPPITGPSTVCDACSAAIQTGVGKLRFDSFSTMRDLSLLIAGGSIPPEPSSSPHGYLNGQSQLFIHHMSVQSLISASLHGCYICRAVWDRVDAQRRRVLLDADHLAPGSDKEFGGPITLCVFFDPESLLADLPGTHNASNMRLWGVIFSDKVMDMLDYGPGDLTFFKFIPSQEAKGLDPIGELRLATNTNSHESLHFAATQLQNCLRNHEECKKSRSSEWLPSRLLCLDSVDEAKTIRLVMSGDITAPNQYCTLSHCWGTAEFLKLTRDNFCAFSRGIPVSDLPKTFQDSFLVSLELGVQYIWIDSLCIIQDDPDDWFNEASHMHEVYSHSLCNICATGASDSSQGLFATRDPLLFRPCEVEIPWYDRGGMFRVLDVTMWDAQVLRAPLNMRAWVVQEHLLAPRHLHFGATQIFWECLKTITAEQFPDCLPESIEFNSQSLRCQIQQCTPLLPGDEEQVKKLRSGWGEIVMRYTRSKISRPRDRAIAFAGIVRRLESILGDKCDAGIWRSDIKRDLLWQVINCRHGDETPAKRPEDYPAPSFSWMSVEGAVHLGTPRTDDSLARVLSMEITESRGFITHGSLRLEGTIRPVRLVRCKGYSGGTWLPRFRHGKPHLGWAMSVSSVAVMDADRDYYDTYFCVLLAGEGEVKYVRGLILQETGRARGEFTRIGFLQCIGEDKELLRAHPEDEDTFPCESYDAVQKRHIISIV